MPAPPASGGSDTKQWHTFVAGATAGLVSEAFTYPLSTAKARLQVQRVAVGETPLYRSTFQTLGVVVRNEGWPKLFAGFGSVLVCSAPARAMYFTGFEFFKRNIGPHIGGDSHPFVSFMGGQFAQLSGSLLWVPQDVIKERLQIQRDIKPTAAAATATATAAAKATASATAGAGAATVAAAEAAAEGHHGPRFTSSVDAFKRILQTEGVRGLYRGYVAHQVVWAPYNGIFMAVYEQFKRQWSTVLPSTMLGGAKPAGGVPSLGAVAGAPPTLPHYAFPVCAAAAGAVAAVVTYPMDLIKTRLQTQGDSGLYKNSLDCFRQIVNKEGPKALFRGLPARIYFVGPNHAITMTIFESLLQWFKKY